MTLFLCPIAMAIASYSHASDYTFTRDRARKLVLDYCHTDCHGLFLKPPVPCCGVFEQAMRGDPSALHRVFTERNLQSGDNESWSFTAWPLLHVVGDGRLRSLSSHAYHRRAVRRRAEGSHRRRACFRGTGLPRADGQCGALSLVSGAWPASGATNDAHEQWPLQRTRRSFSPFDTLLMTYGTPAFNQAMHRTAKPPLCLVSRVCQSHFHSRGRRSCVSLEQCVGAQT
jgi:hypothetical protein